MRLPDYDYSKAGAYFVTICTRGRACVLEDPVVAEIILSVWTALPNWFPTIALDEFVIMPNHVHLIVWLQSGGGNVGATFMVAHDGEGAQSAGASPAPTGGGDDDDVGATLAVAPQWTIPKPQSLKTDPTLGDVIGAFKSLVFKTYRQWIETYEPERQAKFWQRNYYEHVIRSNKELLNIRQYIRDNPLKWELDRDNPASHHPEVVSGDDYLLEANALK